MKKYKEITDYRKLMRHWHPDMCKEAEQRCKEMTGRISEAYNIIIEYCNHYRFSFSREEVRENLSEEEWLRERFGKDPVWGSGA
jgi:DnaJ-class molecular chaperone